MGRSVSGGKDMEDETMAGLKALARRHLVAMRSAGGETGG